MIAAVLVLALPTPLAQDAPDSGAGPLAPYTEAELRELWERLPERQRRGWIDYLRLDLSHGDAFSLVVVRHALGLSDRDPGFWSDAPEPMWFDPQEHAPAQPIARRPLAADDRAAEKFLERLAGPVPPRRVSAAWAYDWASGEPVRLVDPDDPTRQFENALAGFPPDLDLAEALVLRALDDGSQASALAAFGHAYTDRSGGVYPGVTLYDAWASGLEIEMPDVDTLGLARSLLKKLDRRWVAPVPTSEHDELYGALADAFVPANRHRGLREALARCYLIGRPAFRDGYTASHLDAFHAFWESHSSDVVAAAEDLPEPDDWGEWLGDWVKRTGKKKDVLQGSVNRRVALENSEAYVQRRLVALAVDMNLFERFPEGEQP